MPSQFPPSAKKPLRLGQRQLTAYQTVPPEGFTITPADHARDWMEQSYERSAYRCLPLLIANQAGWVIRNPATVRVRWTGGANLDAIELQRWQPADSADKGLPDYVWPTSHFGSGIITWNLPFLFRTPKGFNLLARGPANTPKDGICALEGIIETDWATATFTMNWKVTRKDTWIAFEQGEPICMIVPQRRGELEEFTPKLVSLVDNPDLKADFDAWCASRDKFFDSSPDGSEWQKDYFHGRTVDGVKASEHQTKLRLKPFS